MGRSTRCRDGIICTRYIHCVKSGKPRDQVSYCKKPLISQKTNCPFKCRAHLVSIAMEELEEAEEKEKWELTVMNPIHNHEPNDPIAHH